MEVEEVQTFTMTPTPTGGPRLIASRCGCLSVLFPFFFFLVVRFVCFLPCLLVSELGSVDDTRRLGTQVFPIGDDRVLALDEDLSLR